MTGSLCYCPPNVSFGMANQGCAIAQRDGPIDSSTCRISQWRSSRIMCSLQYAAPAAVPVSPITGPIQCKPPRPTASTTTHPAALSRPVAVVGCNLDCKSEGGSASEGSLARPPCRQCMNATCNPQGRLLSLPDRGRTWSAGWPGRTVRSSNSSTLGAHLHDTGDDMEKHVVGLHRPGQSTVFPQVV